MLSRSTLLRHFKSIQSIRTMSSSSNSGSRPDTNPGSSIPEGPSRTQPATNNQKDFADQLGVKGNMPAQPTKGEASDVISNTLNGQQGQNNGASGAAPDNTPGDVKPTGPSAKQPATNNQKGYLNAVGATEGLSDSTTKGQASDMIEKAIDGGARPPQGDGQGGAGIGAGAGGRSGAAQDTTPGSQIPTGPSAKQPATNNQKTLINSLGASDQISTDTTKGEASDIISKNQS